MGLDLLIRNGTIVDGSGAARYRGDVGIAGGRIVEIGHVGSVAERTIDADGLIVAPGSVGGTKALVDRTAVIGAGAATPGEEPTTRSLPLYRPTR